MSASRSSHGRAAIAAALVGAAMLGGCTSSRIIDSLPAAVGGLPEGVPPRPTAQVDYPAVHAMPPPRNDPTLSFAEKKRLEDELIAARTRARQGANADTNATNATAGAARNP